MGDYIIIHKSTEFKGTHVEKEGVIQGCSPKGNLCNPYDEGGVKTGDNIDVTCKNCLHIMEAKRKLIGYEITIKENKRGSWKEHIPHTRCGKSFMNCLDKIIDKYGAETKSSFKAIYKINGGYGKNKKADSTFEVNWKGKLNRIYNILKFPDPNETPSLLEEYYEGGHKAFNKKEDEDQTIEKVWKCSDCGKMKPRWHRRDAKCDDCGSTKYEQDGDLRWDVPKDKDVDS